MNIRQALKASCILAIVGFALQFAPHSFAQTSTMSKSSSERNGSGLGVGVIFDGAQVSQSPAPWTLSIFCKEALPGVQTEHLSAPLTGPFLMKTGMHI